MRDEVARIVYGRPGRFRLIRNDELYDACKLALNFECE
jgi:hypothetical protein